MIRRALYALVIIPLTMLANLIDPYDEDDRLEQEE